MTFEETGFEGLRLVVSQRHADERGHFVRTFCEDSFRGAGLVSHFPQTSTSFNAKRGTVRGMHFSAEPHAETKLVRCIAGAIHDVVVDLRASSTTYLKAYGVDLSAENGLALYIPEGFAHGFQTLADDTSVSYAITPAFVPGAARGLRWDDPALSVTWPLPISVISDRDGEWPLLEWDAA